MHFRIPVLVLIVALCVAIVACSESRSVEEQIATQLRNMADAAEAGDVRKAAGVIAGNYSDLRGNDRQAIVNQLRLARMQTGKLAVFLDINSISLITATLVEVDLVVRFAGIDTGRFAIDGAQYRFILECEQQGSDWLIVAARWTQGSGEPR